MYKFPAGIEHIAVDCPEGVDLLERFELFRQSQWHGKIEVPLSTGLNLERLMTYLDEARKEHDSSGQVIFPEDANLGHYYGLIGPNPYGDGYATGVQWAGMVILDMREDDTFAVTIAWSPASVEGSTNAQKAKMHSVKAFFESKK